MGIRSGIWGLVVVISAYKVYNPDPFFPSPHPLLVLSVLVFCSCPLLGNPFFLCFIVAFVLKRHKASPLFLLQRLRLLPFSITMSASHLISSMDFDSHKTNHFEAYNDSSFAYMENDFLYPSNSPADLGVPIGRECPQFSSQFSSDLIGIDIQCRRPCRRWTFRLSTFLSTPSPLLLSLRPHHRLLSLPTSRPRC